MHIDLFWLNNFSTYINFKRSGKNIYSDYAVKCCTYSERILPPTGLETRTVTLLDSYSKELSNVDNLKENDTLRHVRTFRKIQQLNILEKLLEIPKILTNFFK